MIRKVPFLIWALALLLLAELGYAQDAIDRAIERAQDARRLFDQGRYDQAYDTFADADRLAHSPVFVLYMARSRRGAGRLMEARELYRRVALESLAPDAADAMRQAQVDAAQELRRLEAEMPRLRVDVEGELAAGARVTVDGRAVSIGAEVELDPGRHQVVARAPGASSREHNVELRAGSGVRRISLSLERPAVESPQDSETPGAVIAGAIVVGVGGLAGIAGAVTGGLALSMAADITGTCVGNACRPEDEDDAAQARRLARASTGLLVAGGISAGIGVTLLVVRPGVDDAQVSVSLGPGSLYLRGRF